MTTITHTIRKFAASFVAAAIVTTSATADVTNVKEALGLALKQEAIAAAGYKMKLYSLSANYNGDNKRWSFQFYDGGTSLHSCSIDKSGKVRYYVRDKGSMRIFDDVDFTKLPAPNEVLIEDLVGQGKAALTALKFKTLDNGKLYVNYYVRSEFRQKDKAYHSWSVTIPIGDGKKGKTVAFKNGAIDTINNSTIYGG
ncbi:MAG: hypothetical protein QNL01_00050 [Akkermansiaceae bacterium]|jgi:hypothetical protein|tara:strand:+ start:11830 stop:12420 length:591 start_codon:yes stop_codon:yes gene_type:complete